MFGYVKLVMTMCMIWQWRIRRDREGWIGQSNDV